MVGDVEGAHCAIEGLLPAIGLGTARTIYRDDAVVYKVDRVPGFNASEINALERLANFSLPADLRLPAWSVYNVEDGDAPAVVLAMEYIDGRESGGCSCSDADSDCSCDTEPKMPDHLRDYVREVLGVGDIALGAGNVIERHGVYYLIDVDASP